MEVVPAFGADARKSDPPWAYPLLARHSKQAATRLLPKCGGVNLDFTKADCRCVSIHLWFVFVSFLLLCAWLRREAIDSGFTGDDLRLEFMVQGMGLRFYVWI